MANTFQSISNGMAMLKNFYEGPIKDQLNKDTPILRGIEKQTKGWSGLQVVRPLRVRRNQGIGATTDGGTLPAIGVQGTTSANISSKFNYLRFGVTGPMIKASASDRGAFVRAASYELEMGYKDLQNDVNRQVSWSGNGTLARVNANTAASTSLVIKGREDGNAAMRFVDVGLVFDIYSGSTLVASGISVTAISGSVTATTATLTLSAPVTCSANDVLVRSGAYNNEIQGLLYSLDGGTSTIYSVDRSVYQAYQGNELDLSGGQLTLDALQRGYNVALYRGGAKLSAHYTDFDSLRMYQKLLTPDKRYVNTTKGDGGFSNKDVNYMEFNGIPVVADKDCPNRWFMLDPGTWKNYVLAEMEFADETGSMYIAQVSADQFEVRIRYFSNMFAEQPSANTSIKNYISP